jgi:methylation protein EvaC
MQKHFAQVVTERLLAGRNNPFVVELGSNDGIMLLNLNGGGIRHLGIKPSAKVADAARAQGIQTVSAFFGGALAERLVAEHGRTDAILAADVMRHIADVASIAEAIRALLKRFIPKVEVTT